MNLSVPLDLAITAIRAIVPPTISVRLDYHYIKIVPLDCISPNDCKRAIGRPMYHVNKVSFHVNTDK